MVKIQSLLLGVVVSVAGGLQVEQMRCEPGRGGDVIGDDLPCNVTAGCNLHDFCEETHGCEGWATISASSYDVSYLRTNLDRSACFKDDSQIPRNIKTWRTNKYSFGLREEYGLKFDSLYCHNGAGGVELDEGGDDEDALYACAFDPNCVAYVETARSAYSFHAIFLSSIDISECEYDTNHQTVAHKFVEQTKGSHVFV